MKKMYCFNALIFLSLAAFCQPITGNWEGKLTAQGTEIPLVFHISKDSTGKLSATFDSPDQKAFNLPCSGVTIQNDSVFIIMKVLNGKYTGKLSEDKKQITGTWFQGGGSAPLTMHKTSDEVKIKEVDESFFNCTCILRRYWKYYRPSFVRQACNRFFKCGYW